MLLAQIIQDQLTENPTNHITKNIYLNTNMTLLIKMI